MLSYTFIFNPLGASLVSGIYSVTLKNGYQAFQDNVATTYQNVVLNAIGATPGGAAGNGLNVIYKPITDFTEEMMNVSLGAVLGSSTTSGFQYYWGKFANSAKEEEKAKSTADNSNP